MDWSDTQLIGEMEIPTRGGPLLPIPTKGSLFLWRRDDDLAVAADLRSGTSERPLLVSVGHPSRYPTDDEIDDIARSFFSEGTTTRIIDTQHIKKGGQELYITSMVEVSKE